METLASSIQLRDLGHLGEAVGLIEARGAVDRDAEHRLGRTGPRISGGAASHAEVCNFAVVLIGRAAAREGEHNEEHELAKGIVKHEADAVRAELGIDRLEDLGGVLAAC